MKKEFQKPILKQYALRLNENIAASWEYYFEHGMINSSYYFTYMVPGIEYPVTHEQGCFTYLSNNPEWNTNEYGGLNNPIDMEDYLLHELIYKLHTTDPTNHFITDCHHAPIIPS
jgi:hypothetical protein